MFDDPATLNAEAEAADRDLYYALWDSLSAKSKASPAAKEAQALIGQDTRRALVLLGGLYKNERLTRADFEEGSWVRVPAGEIANLVLTCAVNTYAVEGRIDRIDSVRVHAGRQEIVVEGPGTISLYKPTEMVEVASRNRMNG